MADVHTHDFISDEDYLVRMFGFYNFIFIYLKLYFQKIIYSNSLNLFFSKRFQNKYDAELRSGKVSPETQFQYSWCLIRSKYRDDIRKGIGLLEGKLL